MPELQDMLKKCQKLDQRCLRFEIMIFVGYLFLLVLSWFAKNEHLSLLGVLRFLRLILVIGEGVVYLSGWRNRKVLRRLRRYRMQTCTMRKLERL